VFPRIGEVPDVGSFYRLLRGLEADGAVYSRWDTTRAGPARRVYGLTETGREQLEGWSVTIDREIAALQRFQSAYQTPANR